MKVTFDKYQGAGNDFIIIDNRDKKYSSLKTLQLKSLCDRYMGIGANGIIFIQSASDADFEMHYFNSDGNPSTLCGNGGRCAVAFANRHQIIKSEAQFRAIDGLHEAKIVSNENVLLKMNNVKELINHEDGILVDTGSPHYIELVENISILNIKKEGAEIRYSVPFLPNGVNVNFLEKKSNSHFSIRTYERGVEDETLACGTGAVAGALAMHHLGKTKGLTKIKLEAIGGTLIVDFAFSEMGYENIQLEGPATFTYSGHINI
tara:strand:+ start:17042 stop:17827 length:786 start_codon:yes stop_codon:yes gene_type:complete